MMVKKLYVANKSKVAFMMIGKGCPRYFLPSNSVMLQSCSSPSPCANHKTCRCAA
jgi:hypothetical protein